MWLSRRLRVAGYRCVKILVFSQDQPKQLASLCEFARVIADGSLQINVHQCADCNGRPRVPSLLGPNSHWDGVGSSAKIAIFLSLYQPMKVHVQMGREATKSASAPMNCPGRYEERVFF